MDAIMAFVDKLGIATWVAIGLAVVRLVESICQVINESDAKGIIAKIWALVKAFCLQLETYKNK